MPNKYAKKPPVSKSKEFLEKKTIEKLKIDRENLMHKFRMEELQFGRDSEEIKHQHEMERQRIKSAEIRKMQERKAQSGQFKY